MGSPTRSIQSASGPLRGSVRVPGSKSLSNRAIIIASLARGESEMSGLLRSDDTESLLRGVAQLGVGIHDDGDDVRIDGCSGSLPDPDAGEIHVDCGHGGTPARFLLALACLSPATVVIDDFLPCDAKGQPAFARSAVKNGTVEIWVMLAEKAYAKLYGSFSAIIGGSEAEALQDLTGGLPSRIGIGGEQAEPRFKGSGAAEEAWTLLNSHCSTRVR